MVYYRKFTVHQPSNSLHLAWKVFGGKSWGWSGLLPYFKKAENVDTLTPPNPWNDTNSVNPVYEGVGGPTQVICPNGFTIHLYS